jgi:hypothetical protein
MPRFRRFLPLAALALLALPAGARAQAATAAPVGAEARATLLGMVDTFFDALAARDTARLRALWAPGVAFDVSVLDPQGTWQHRTVDPNGYLAGLTRGTETLLERYWEPTVLLDGGIGVVWARYDFHVNGAFSHCGIDNFVFTKRPEGWRISYANYTVQRTGCPASPLGPAGK